MGGCDHKHNCNLGLVLFHMTNDDQLTQGQNINRFKYISNIFKII